MRAKITLAVCITALAVASLEALRLRFGEQLFGGAKARRAKELEGPQAGIRALRALEAATEVGLELSDYHSRLIDAKIAVSDALSRVSSVSDDVLRNSTFEITQAMHAYEVALTTWRAFGLRERRDLYVFTASEVKDDTILSSILKLYPNIEGDSIDGKTYYSKDAMLKGIWKSASEHTDQAEKILRQ